MAVPRVVVALGALSADLSERIANGPARGLSPVVRQAGLTLWSSGRVEKWRHGRRRGWFWWRLRPDGRPRSAEEAADACEALGVEVAPERIVVHGSSLGMQPFYYRRLGDALVFASSIADLCALSDAPLNPDWAAWAAILTVRGPLGDQTPFTEIRRVRGGDGWQWDRRDGRLTTTRWMPSFAADPSERRSGTAADAADLAAAVRDAVATAIRHTDLDARWPRPRRRSKPGWTITLSGGGDSRLLAAYASRLLGPDRLVAYTTSPDDGSDLDLQLSIPVAFHLGVPQEVVLPDAEDWPEYTRRTFARVEYQTPYHMWIEPLASTLRDRGSPVIDGLAGDVLLKSGLLGEKTIAAPPERRGPVLWKVVSGPPSPGRLWVTEEVNAELRRLSRPGFDRERERFAGHPSELELTLLFVRTSRSIALSPFALFGPECLVAVPYLDREVMQIALSVPPDVKLGGRFFHECLQATDRRLASLASTARPPVGVPRPRARIRSASPPAIAWAMKSLTALAHRQGLDVPREEQLSTLARSSGRIWLHGLLMLNEWLERYESRLTETKAPWW